MKTDDLTKKLVLPAIFLMAFALGYYIASYQFSLLHMAEELTLSNAQVGVLAGAAFFTQIFVPFLFGIPADKIGKRPFLILAACLFVTAMFLFFTAKSFPALLTAALVAGAGFGTMEGLYLSVLADYYPEKITRYNNFAQMVFGLGAFLGPLVAYALIKNGWLWRQVFIGPMILFCTVFILLLIMRLQKKREMLADGTEKPISFSLFKEPLFYMLLIWIMIYVGIETCLVSFADLYIAHDLNAPDISALSISLFWLMMVPSRLLGGLMKKNHMRLLILFCALIIVLSLLTGFVQNGYAALACVAVAGFLCGPIWPTVFSFNQRAFPQATGTVGSFGSGFSGIGGFALPALVGFLSEGKPLSTVYYLTAAAAAVMLVVGLVAGRSLKGHRVSTD